MAEPQHQNNHPASSPAVTWCTKNPGCSQDAPCDECQALADGRIAEVHLIEYRHHRVRVPWVLLRRAWLADQPLYLPDPGAADDPQPGWLGGDEEPGRNVWEVLAPGLGGGDLGAIRVQEVALEYPDAGQFAEALALWLAGRRRLQETEAAAGGSQPAAGPAAGKARPAMTDIAGTAPARFAVVPRALALYLSRCRRRSRFYAGETTADLPAGGPWQSEDLEIPRRWNPRHLDREDLWDPEVLVAEAVGCQAITTPAGLHVELTILAGDGPACDAAYTWQVGARGVPFALIAPNPWRLKNLGNGTVGAAAADQANDLIGGYQAITGQPFTARDAPESPAAS